MEEVDVRQQGGGRHRRPEPPPRPWAARPRLLGALAVAVAVVAAGVALLVPAASARLQGDRSPAQPQAEANQSPEGASPARPTPDAPAATQPRTLAAGPVAVDFDGFLSWALLDRTGRISGSANLAATTSSESMVRIWIVSDYLRRIAEQGKKPTAERLAQASRAIREGDIEATQALYSAGGGAAQIRRMISKCGLSDTRADSSRWRRTQISARDAARLGGCVAGGRAAGPSWTRWVRTEMTKVNGGSRKAGQPTGGRWGIVDGLPDEVVTGGVGIQNGWRVVSTDDEWRVNCLAVADEWSLAVLTRYPVDRGLGYGAQACAEVAAQLVTRASPPT